MKRRKRACDISYKSTLYVPLEFVLENKISPEDHCGSSQAQISVKRTLDAFNLIWDLDINFDLFTGQSFDFDLHFFFWKQRIVKFLVTLRILCCWLEKWRNFTFFVCVCWRGVMVMFNWNISHFVYKIILKYFKLENDMFE